MEVVGALASSLQIVSQCTQVTMTIIKWAEAVRTVDDRIDAFVHEVTTLRMTYESLNRSLKEPSMLEAARITNRDVGGHLWTQVSRTLQDCERTMLAIANVLRRIHSSKSILRPVIKQLRENLNSGELVRLREQVVMFNSSLQLPMQMITLTLQLRQQEMTTSHQLQLNDQLTILRKGIDRIERISRGLQTQAPRRNDTSTSGSTLVGDITIDKTWADNMEDYVETARKFLDSASVAATTMSAPSTRQHDDDNAMASEARRGSTFMPLTVQKLRSINMYVDDLPAESNDTPQASDAQSMSEKHHEIEDDSDDDDVDLQLLQALLTNGNNEVDQSNFAKAEDNYREALSVSQSNSFGPRLACSTADIALMLGECLARQDKYDEAIALLQPLAGQPVSRHDSPLSSGASMLSQSQRNADKGQALSASHLLGEVYLKKPDFVNAETHAVHAFKGRKRLLGEAHPKTIESVTLVIDMYKAKGQHARAEAHRIFLKPVQPIGEARAIMTSPALSHTPSSPPAEPVGIPMALSPSRTRRPTFSFSSAFKRSERTETPISSPLKRHSSGGSPLLIAEESNQLSTSPHNTSSLHMGSDRLVDKQVRKDSTNSNDSYTDVQRWGTKDIVDQYMGTPSHQRTRTSLSRAPTIYAGLSRAEMEQKFSEIAQYCVDGKTSKAVDKGIHFLQKYDPDSAIFVHRAAELKENVKKSRTKGLAGTGHGFAPIHFFCSMKYEPLTEIEILLLQGADANAVAYKAGYGKLDPFTPLSLAVERGNTKVVRMLLENGATWTSEQIKQGHRFNADRDSTHPLLHACSRGYVAIAETLLEYSMELTEELFPRLSWHGNSLLHEACFRCDLGMVELFMRFARRNGLLGETGYSFVGRPGQQDVFGVTPIMYAVDMRDSSDPDLRMHKLRTRVACLKLLLEEDTDIRVTDTDNEEVFVEQPQPVSGRSAVDLQLEDKKGNTVYWYADEARGGDAELRAYLDEKSRRSRLIEF